jgi:hypothetical protein
MKCQNKGSFTVGTMQTLLGAALDNVEGEFAGVGHPDWWAKGATASGLNSGALNAVYHEMAKALNGGPSSSPIEI